MVSKRLFSKALSTFLSLSLCSFLNALPDDYWDPEKYHLHSSSQKDAALELLKHINFNSTDAVLDVGCGDGKITAEISNLVPDGIMIGIDASSAMIYFAKHNFIDVYYKNLKFISLRVEDLYYEKCFDKVVSFTALQWVQDHKAVIKKINESLKPEGTFAFTMPMGLPRNLQRAVDEVIEDPKWSPFFENFSTGWNFIEKAQYEKLLEDEGFSLRLSQVVRQEDIFPSVQAFYDFIYQWFPYVKVLHSKKHKEFMDLILNRYIELEPFDEKGQLHFRINRLEIVAVSSAASEVEEKLDVNLIQEGFAPVEEGNLCYKKRGEGVPIIAIHGGPGLDHTYLEPQLTHFAKDHQLIFYDQRGSGRSLETPINEKYITLEQFAKDLDDLRKELQLDKVILMGHSWGGVVSMQYAITYPENVLGLVLINPAPADYKGQKAFTDEWEKRIGDRKEEFASLSSYEEFKKLNEEEITNLYRKLLSLYMYDPNNIQDLTLTFDEPSAQSGIKTLEMMCKTSWMQPRIDLFPELAKLNTPTLIIHGKQDIVPSWTAQEIQKAIQGSELVLIDECDHYSYVEKPKEFFETVDAFLEKLKN